MTFFIIILIIVAVVIMVKKNKKKSDAALSKTNLEPAIANIPSAQIEVEPLQFNLTITPEITLNTSNEIKTVEKVQRRGAGYILNPGAAFKLTLLNADEQLAQQIQDILEDNQLYENKKRDRIVALFSEHNLQVKEVNEYKEKYGKIYHDKIEELKNASSEWQTLGEKDKEDLLADFRAEALKAVYEQADCDLVILFEKEPSDVTVDDDLIKEYGFENIETYLRFADNLQKIRVVQKDNYNRPHFEKLAELGLAIRGNAIPLEEILSTLTLKDLNSLAENSEKEFKRKNQAVEYILALPNIQEKLGSKISLRELFKLQPLPEKYSSVNLKAVSDAWSFSYEVVQLLINTYTNAMYSQALSENEFVKEFKVLNFKVEDRMCPCAKDLMNKTYTKKNAPHIPYHVGCNCSLRQVYDFN